MENQDMRRRLKLTMRAGPPRKTAKAMIVGVLLATSLFISAASAQISDKSIVVFDHGATEAQINSLVTNWKASGIDIVMRVPLINGAVVRLPAGLAVTDVSSDSLVENVEADENLDVLTMDDDLTVQSIEYDTSISLYDTSNNLLTMESLLGEGGAGEGGAGEGGATPLITPFPEPPNNHRPWGVLDTYAQPFNRTLYTDNFNEKSLTPLVRAALENTSKLKIGVLDTGIDYTHDAFKNEILGGINLLNMLPGTPQDDNGHGTHIAGTIVAKGFALAPKAKLYAVKILDANAAGEISTLIMALQWAINNDLDVVNMSVGFRDDNPLVRLAVENAYDAGLIMVAAVGNYSNWIDGGGAGEGGAGEGGAGEGGAGCTDPSLNCTPDGHYPVMYPALYPEVIGVAAMDPYYNLASFSNDGPEVDVLAPGVDVVSLNLGNSYGVANGTSMATPHVTAVIALMVALANSENVTLSPLDVITILGKSSAESGGLINLNGLLGETNAVVKKTLAENRATSPDDGSSNCRGNKKKC